MLLLAKQGMIFGIFIIGPLLPVKGSGIKIFHF